MERISATGLIGWIWTPIISAVMSLDITAIGRELGAAGVRYILTGSVAAAAYGVTLEPRDFDIAPDLEPENLARLAQVLRRWHAKPVSDPDWPESLTPEECERWTPDPPTSQHLDQLLMTPYGLFDVVPTRSIAYADLVHRALAAVFEERAILVAHPADLIAGLRMHKAKHLARLPHLNAILMRLERGESIMPRLPFW
jgi:hypothetical protein